jgi:hypothetical protein
MKFHGSTSIKDINIAKRLSLKMKTKPALPYIGKKGAGHQTLSLSNSNTPYFGNLITLKMAITTV